MTDKEILDYIESCIRNRHFQGRKVQLELLGKITDLIDMYYLEEE